MYCKTKLRTADVCSSQVKPLPSCKSSLQMEMKLDMELKIWPGDWGLPTLDDKCLAVMVDFLFLCNCLITAFVVNYRPFTGSPNNVAGRPGSSSRFTIFFYTF